MLYAYLYINNINDKTLEGMEKNINWNVGDETGSLTRVDFVDCFAIVGTIILCAFRLYKSHRTRLHIIIHCYVAKCYTCVIIIKLNLIIIVIIIIILYTGGIIMLNARRPSVRGWRI